MKPKQVSIEPLNRDRHKTHPESSGSALHSHHQSQIQDVHPQKSSRYPQAAKRVRAQRLSLPNPQSQQIHYSNSAPPHRSDESKGRTPLQRLRQPPNQLPTSCTVFFRSRTSRRANGRSMASSKSRSDLQDPRENAFARRDERASPLSVDRPRDHHRRSRRAVKKTNSCA